MSEIFEYTIDGIKLPAVLKKSTEPIDDEELSASIKSVQCPFATADALQRTVYIEAAIGAPIYSTAVTSQDPLALSDSSATPGLIHLKPHSVAVVRASIDEMKLGDAYIIVGRRTLERDNEIASVGVVLAIVPWFVARSMSLESGTVSWSMATIPNILYSMLEKIPHLYLMRCQRIRPFMPFAEENNTVALPSGQIELMGRQVLAFLLRWHQTRTAVHPSIVKQGIRVCDRKELARESLKLGDSLDAWRDMQLEAVLNNRSFVFFGKTSPRVALLESPHCWDALSYVVNTFLSPMYGTFVINEFLDVMRFVIQTEVLEHGELAVFHFAVDYLKKMSEGLCKAEKEHFAACIDTAASQTTGGKNAPIASAAFVAFYSHHLRKTQNEALEMRVETISELRQRARTEGTLSEAEISYLSGIDELDLSKTDEMRTEQLRANMENNIVCVSHNFFVGSELVSKALYGDKNNNKVHSVIIKKGRRYMTTKLALDLSISLTRVLLEIQMSADANGAVMSKLEREFSQAAPHSGGLYPESDHTTTFDDVAIGSDDFRQVRASLNAQELREFQAGRRDSLPLPSDFDMAKNRGLLVSDNDLVHVVSLSGTINSKRHGNVSVHKLALYGVTHKDRCLKRKCEASSTSRAHIEIDFDTENDDSRRTTKLLEVERQVRSIDPTKFTEATRAAEQGRPAPMTDIEDVIGNMYENNALPLCVRMLARTVQQRQGVGYLQNSERILFYRLMRSFDAPEITDQAVLRFLYKNMPPGKIRELNSDATRSWPNMIGKRHNEEAAKHIEYQARSNNTVSRENALKATTCAPSCWGMIGPKVKQYPSRCPFRELPDPQLFDLLQESGTDDDGIERILAARGKYGYQCKLQFIHSRPAETRDTNPFTPYTQDAFFQHPHHYMLASADHLLRHREACAVTSE